MTRITVSLTAGEKDALRVLAEREFRDPRAQAALLIRRGLEDAGCLRADVPDREQGKDQSGPNLSADTGVRDRER